MGQLIVSPDADVETNTVDGEVEHNDETASKTFHEIVTAAGTGFDDDGIQAVVLLWASTGAANKWRQVRRAVLLFDTSSIPATATITAATLDVHGTTKSDGLVATPNINVYSSNPGSDDALIAGDYDSFGTTELATSITYANFDDADWNTFTLNAAGRAAIDKSGITRLGLRNANYDVADELDPNNHDPPWTSNQTSGLGIATADSANAPYLTVDYTVDHVPYSATISAVATGVI